MFHIHFKRVNTISLEVYVKKKTVYLALVKYKISSFSNLHNSLYELAVSKGPNKPFYIMNKNRLRK